jgi:hypothetical protein
MVPFAADPAAGAARRSGRSATAGVRAARVAAAAPTEQAEEALVPPAAAGSDWSEF